STSGTAIDTVVSSGAIFQVLSGAIADHVTIMRGGTLVVQGGKVTHLTLKPGATEYTGAVSSGMTVRGGVISSLPTETVYAGGRTIGVKFIDSEQIVSSGGVASGSILSRSAQEVEAGGVAARTVIGVSSFQD